MVQHHYLHFAMETRKVIDLLINLIDKPNHPHEYDVMCLKDELVKALDIMTAVESKALRQARS